ncbi:MAG: hypothetical protein Rsou_0836 [Candidatus Ruthia sp. Asou_11_S2]|nr:hypothetical protein [Candidatus Ruthia sp. Asou_11_S2]
MNISELYKLNDWMKSQNKNNIILNNYHELSDRLNYEESFESAKEAFV